MLISADSIKAKNLIENRLFHLLKQENELFDINPSDLLTPNRFDIAIKLSYLCNKDIAPKFSSEIYADHILAFGGGRFHEPEKAYKNSLDVFLAEFLSITKEIQERGFDGEKSIIPLARDGSILNGAHRVAAAIFFGKKVKAIKLDADPSKYDYAFFAERHTPWSTLLSGLQEYMQRRPDMRIAIYWPKASHLIDYRPKHVVTEYSDTLTLTELAGFVRQVYRAEPWLGNPGNNYRGAFHKAKNCYKENSLLKVVVFLAEPTEDLLAIKEAIRNELNLGKHCLHISDHVQDTQQVINFLFNKNSRRFLSGEDFSRFPNKDRKVNKVFDALVSMDADLNKTTIDSSFVLEIYGLRQASDIDVISIDSNACMAALEELDIDNHNQLFSRYELSVNEIICNPRYHFWYNSVKFVTLDVLKEFKQRRREQKDIQDVAIIDSLVNQSKWMMQKAKFKQRMFYSRLNLIRKTKRIIASALRKLGVLNHVKRLFGGR